MRKKGQGGSRVALFSPRRNPRRASPSVFPDWLPALRTATPGSDGEQRCGRRDLRGNFGPSSSNTALTEKEAEASATCPGGGGGGGEQAGPPTLSSLPSHDERNGEGGTTRDPDGRDGGQKACFPSPSESPEVAFCEILRREFKFNFHVSTKRVN